MIEVHLTEEEALTALVAVQHYRVQLMGDFYNKMPDTTNVLLKEITSIINKLQCTVPGQNTNDEKTRIVRLDN